MRIRSLAIVLVMVLGATSGAASASDTWPQSGRNAQATRYNPGEHAITRANAGQLHLTWTLPFSGPMAVVGGRLYAVSGCRVVSADMHDGRVLRTVFSGSAPACPTALAYGRGQLIVATGRSIAGVVAATGRILWHVNVVAQWLAVNGDSLYTGAGCQSTPDICGKPLSTAIDLRTGQVLWKNDENFGGQPVVAGRLLYRSVGVFWGMSRIYDAITGNLISQLRYLHAHWLGDGRDAYVEVARGPLQGSWLGRVNVAGKAAWRVELGKVNPHVAPALAYHILFAPAQRSGSGVVAVDPDTGRILWYTRLTSDVRLAVANQLVFALETGSGRLIVLDAGDGHVRAAIAVPHAPNAHFTDVAVAGGSVLVTGDGSIRDLQP